MKIKMSIEAFLLLNKYFPRLSDTFGDVEVSEVEAVARWTVSIWRW